MSTTTGLDPYFRLYAPDGTLISAKAVNGPYGAELDINALPSSGTYVLLAEESGFNETGEYRIFVQRRNNPQITTPIGFGENLSATIDAFGEVDTYTFDAIEGNVVMVRMSTTTGLDPYFRLYGPDGSLVTTKVCKRPGRS